MLFDGKPLIICAEVREGSAALPLSIIRQCEGCDLDLMTAPSSAPMIADGAHPCCMSCAMFVRALMGDEDGPYELVPGSLDEVSALLGPKAAAQSAALVESFNRAARRRSN